MVEILDENGFNQIDISSPQSRLGSIEMTERPSVLFHQLSVIDRQILSNPTIEIVNFLKKDQYIFE